MLVRARPTGSRTRRRAGRGRFVQVRSEVGEDLDLVRLAGGDGVAVGSITPRTEPGVTHFVGRPFVAIITRFTSLRGVVTSDVRRAGRLLRVVTLAPFAFAIDVAHTEAERLGDRPRAP